jgi:hypothetical protein
MKALNSLLLFSLVFLAGCKKDFLDIKPKGQMIPKTTDDYRQILDFVSNKNNVGQKVCLLANYGIVNLLADDYQVSDSTQYKAMLNTDRKLWFEWGRSGSYNEELDDPDWKALYGQIYIMNSALEGLPVAEGPAADKDQLMAEAHFHRAFCLLGLVNIYAKHYNTTSANTDLGIPLRLTTSLTESLQRATVQETYDQIISDLNAAVEDLPANQGIYNHRPSSAAGYALLARTYLYMGKYDKALEFSQKSLDVTNFLYDFNTTLDRNSTSTRYNYFPTTHRSWDDKEILVQKETAYMSSLYHYSYITSWGPDVRALYDTTGDLRFRNYFNYVPANGGYTYTANIKRWQDAFYYPQVGLTVPEMYLTRAEASARLNKLPEAIADLNALRSKRFITSEYTPYDASALSPEQVLQMVKDERRRELWGRGLRWFDLKRYNALDNANISITRHFTNDKLTPGDKGWVVPIAQLYINQNPEIQQN